MMLVMFMSHTLKSRVLYDVMYGKSIVPARSVKVMLPRASNMSNGRITYLTPITLSTTRGLFRP